ncbi:MAG: MFS transporter [Candidatus Poribacteria bacterium]|nr:MAG: MFS transporter [Candidatus Poribacteria bacterium]
MYREQATTIQLFSLRTPAMRAFHLAWMAFFLAFFGWFSVAPLMPVIREDLGLSPSQIADTIIASVALTVLARVLIGPLCDRFGARRTYAALLILGAVPVAGIGLANSYGSFLLCRLAIGAIGASFVVTQYHTSVMFAPNVVGTANATTAGWGNLGGGVVQMVMPLVYGAVVSLGIGAGTAWRLTMLFPAALLVLVGIAYLRFTQDTPIGNFPEARGELLERVSGSRLWSEAVRDPRVWALFLIYAACFGVELTMNNIAALYYHDRFGLNLKTAGLLAGCFGLMNLFARALGGALSDRIAARFGVNGRVHLLQGVLFLEGVLLVVFSRMDSLFWALATMVVFSLFVQMAEGATYGVVPLVNRRALGTVSGIVGAGGNVGAVAAGMLLRSERLSIGGALFLLGLSVVAISWTALFIRLSEGAVGEPEPALVASALPEAD